MATETMGRVLTEARIENLKDLWDVQAGRLPADQAQRNTSHPRCLGKQKCDLALVADAL